ncbi:MAG TPA: pilus assembly protein N-terminal domain-containing protein [Alphaproteobacteria bacterium]|nr:pilus assembly protein N-terminal domain-containing protein [Alphaproteobacteria bacterium]HOO51150.1 pilus assembly protein N-terminal domain-containing protein [Alphaproteobacteria bacterium]
MTDKNTNSKKLLVPLSYCCMLGLAVWGGTGLIPEGVANTQAGTQIANNGYETGYVDIEPSAGQEISQEMMLAQIDMEPSIPTIEESEIIDAPAIEELETTTSTNDTQEMTPLRISPDKPEIIELDRGAVNVIVGSEENLRAVPDTNRSIILIPKKPGATYFKALDEDGQVIMQRHVIIGGPKSEYVRVRRACVNGEAGCKEFSMYYCPDACHEVGVIQDKKETMDSETAPLDTVSPKSSSSTTEYNPNASEPITE